MNNWNYEEAFKRNLGLINPEEQAILRRSRIAIAGQGGVGGIHLMTLARLGIGKFTIADPDTFETANFNRQYGATVSTLGKSKVEVMTRLAQDINPEIEITAFNEPITPSNAAQFLENADIFVDGIDAFEIDIRRCLFRIAAEKNIYGVTAGPIGFSTAWLAFDPKGMTFDRYFDFTDGMDADEKFVAFIVGLTPALTHRSYIDLKYVDLKKHTGPSASLSCQLSAGVMAAEILKILLKRGPVKAVPHYQQFDAYKNKFAAGYMINGNGHPLQRLKRWWLTRRLRRLDT